MARRVTREEGILIGASGGLALHAALMVASELPPDKTVLVILPDGGRPYLSKVFNDDWMLVHGMFDGAARAPTASSGRTPWRGGSRSTRPTATTTPIRSGARWAPRDAAS